MAGLHWATLAGLYWALFVFRAMARLHCNGCANGRSPRQLPKLLPPMPPMLLPGCPSCCSPCRPCCCHMCWQRLSYDAVYNMCFRLRCNSLAHGYSYNVATCSQQVACDRQQPRQPADPRSARVRKAQKEARQISPLPTKNGTHPSLSLCRDFPSLLLCRSWLWHRSLSLHRLCP